MTRMIDARSVLAVRDLDLSTRFYMDVLGFKRDFGDGSDGWSFLSRDGFKVMLGHCADETPAGELGNHSYFAYVLCEGVDQLYKEISARDADISSALASKPWGLREFGVRTPDGHRIMFGEPLPDRAR
jgi:catechol 2,3-dioxygenase-like lactoylglutathione lyase family enzyme